MNKQEKIIVAILAIVLMGSVYLTKEDAKARNEYLRQQQVEQEKVVAAQQAEAAQAAALAPPPAIVVPSEGSEAILLTAPVAPIETVSGTPEEIFTLSNSVAVITLTSKGGGIKTATLLDYNKTLKPEDGSVELDFTGAPSLALEGIPGLSAKNDFAIAVAADGKSAVMTATTVNGIRFERQVSLTEGYEIAIADKIQNTAADAYTVPGYKIALGPMNLVSDQGPDTDLAIDAQVTEAGKKSVIEIAKGSKKISFSTLFGASGGGCKATVLAPTAPAKATTIRTGETFWATARERFFLQVLTPSVPATGMDIRAERQMSTAGGAFVLKSISAALVQPEATLESGASLDRNYSLFIGPRKMSELRKLGDDYTKIMRFGLWAFFCRGLLDILNFLYGLIPNYGIAIILITAMVRLILYPVNKKNADSMRKMQEIQPLIKAAQAKYKEEPKKLQAETMRIYGENKVNPLSSCLPMLIQLPVFIALFTVLRSAVELRFAPFLWIADLSQPENLFPGLFLGYGLNILPIAMAATMALQSYLTPTAGDPAQQKMMMVMMPVMMLVMFYKFPAALGLYWTVSQVFAIVALLRTRAKKGKGKASSSTSVINPPRETRQMRRDRERGI